MNRDPNQVVFLLGAGASLDAGIPNAAQLTKRMLDELNSENRTHGSRVHALALNYVVAALQLHEVKKGATADQLPNIEHVVSAVEMLSEREDVELTPFVSAWDGYLGLVEELDPPPATWASLRNGGPSSEATTLIAALAGIRDESRYRQLHRILLRLLRSTLEVPEGADLSYLRPMVELGRNGQVVIATLNYDLAIEHVSRSLGVPCSTGIDDWARRWQLEWPQRGVKLIKLHGSIDWNREVFDPSMERGEMGLPQTILRTAGSQADVDDPYDLPSDPIPLVVYGRREKLRSEGPFLDLRAEFVKELKRASHLVVVGYGFGDEHVNSLITHWINSDSARRLVVLDPDFPINWGHANGYKYHLLSGLMQQDGALMSAFQASRMGIVRDTARKKLSSVTQGSAALDAIVDAAVTVPRSPAV